MCIMLKLVDFASKLNLGNEYMYIKSFPLLLERLFMLVVRYGFSMLKQYAWVLNMQMRDITL